jgi:hypothetical protein
MNNVPNRIKSTECEYKFKKLMSAQKINQHI